MIHPVRQLLKLREGNSKEINVVATNGRIYEGNLIDVDESGIAVSVHGVVGPGMFLPWHMVAGVGVEEEVLGG